MASIAEITQIIQNVAVSSAAAVTAYAAMSGLRSWRAEIRERDQYAKAKQLLRCVYEVRDSFQTAREPYFDTSDQPASLSEPNSKRQASGNRSTEELDFYRKRLAALDESLDSLRTAQIDAEVQWYEDKEVLRDALTGLMTCRAELVGAIRQLVVLGGLPLPNESSEKYKARLNQLYDTVHCADWQNPRQEFSLKIVEAVHRYESFLVNRIS